MKVAELNVKNDLASLLATVSVYGSGRHASKGLEAMDGVRIEKTSLSKPIYKLTCLLTKEEVMLTEERELISLTQLTKEFGCRGTAFTAGNLVNQNFQNVRAEAKSKVELNSLEGIAEHYLIDLALVGVNYTNKSGMLSNADKALITSCLLHDKKKVVALLADTVSEFLEAEGKEKYLELKDSLKKYDAIRALGFRLANYQSSKDTVTLLLSKADKVSFLEAIDGLRILIKEKDIPSYAIKQEFSADGFELVGFSTTIVVTPA